MGANENVVAVPVLLSMRLLFAISNDAPVTCHPIAPDDIPADGAKSGLVDILMPHALPAATPPMVTPVSVTVMAVLAASVLPAVVVTIQEAVRVAMVPREANKTPPDTASVGETFVAKKLM